MPDSGPTSLAPTSMLAGDSDNASNPSANPVRPGGRVGLRGSGTSGAVTPRSNLALTGSPSADAEARSAVITRQQYDDFQQRYRPIEDQFLADAANENRAFEATENVDRDTYAQHMQGFQRAERQIRDYGGQLNPDQREALLRSTQQRSSADSGRIKNSIRSAEEERRIGDLSNVVSIGREVQGEALGQYSTASSLTQSRNLANKRAEEAEKQQKRANQIGGAVTGAAIGAEYGSSMGPWGAVVGGVVGLIAGSF